MHRPPTEENKKVHRAIWPGDGGVHAGNSWKNGYWKKKGALFL